MSVFAPTYLPTYLVLHLIVTFTNKMIVKISFTFSSIMRTGLLVFACTGEIIHLGRDESRAVLPCSSVQLFRLSLRGCPFEMKNGRFESCKHYHDGIFFNTNIHTYMGEEEELYTDLANAFFLYRKEIRGDNWADFDTMLDR